MKFKDSIENYPSPIIAVSTDNFVLAKNYLASLSFPNIHVSAKISNYTQIDVKNEKLAKGVFYGKEYTYFSTYIENDDEPYYLLVISLSTFGEDLMSFNPIEIYKKKVEFLTKDECASTTDPNQKRRYIRSVYNNMVKVNFFNQFRGLFEIELNRNSSGETSEIYKTFLAMRYLFIDNFEDVDVKFEFGCDGLIANISELHLVSMLLNSLAFCVLNSNSQIEIKLKDNIVNAEISMEFYSKHDVFALYTEEKSSEDNALLNSAFSLCISLELAKCNGVDFTITKERVSDKAKYIVKHIVPTRIQTETRFTSGDKTKELLEKIFNSVFYDIPAINN